jgi:hypothetical protein
MKMDLIELIRECERLSILSIRDGLTSNGIRLLTEIKYVMKQNKELLETLAKCKTANHEWMNDNKHLIKQNTQLRKDSMSIDHSETCMCKSCQPEFNKLKS